MASKNLNFDDLPVPSDAERKAAAKALNSPSDWEKLKDLFGDVRTLVSMLTIHAYKMQRYREHYKDRVINIQQDIVKLEEQEPSQAAAERNDTFGLYDIKTMEVSQWSGKRKGHFLRFATKLQ